jgi:hypothetical protein
MLPFVWFFTGRYFDKVSGVKKRYDPSVNYNLICPASLARALMYSGFILFNGGMKKSYAKMVYGDINFRKYARKIDWFIAIITWGAFIFAGVFSVLAIFVAWIF